MAAVNFHRPAGLLCSFLYPPALRRGLLLSGVVSSSSSCCSSSSVLLLRRLRRQQPFSSSSRVSGTVASMQSGPRGIGPAAGTAVVKKQTSPAASIGIREAIRKGEIPPLDVGLLPGTFVMPTGARKPSLLRAPRRRAALEWHRLKTRFRDYLTVIYYKWAIVDPRRRQSPRPKLHTRRVGGIARRLHSDMYSAFAAGDVAALKKICAEGLLNNFSQRISRRRPRAGAGLKAARETLFEWNLHKYLGRSRIVSHRAAVLPGVEGAAVRQVVVRIRSRQSLKKKGEAAAAATVKNGGGEEGGDGQPKDLDEYVVVQRSMFKYKEDPWVVWGTMQETDPDEVLGPK